MPIAILQLASTGIAHIRKTLKTLSSRMAFLCVPLNSRVHAARNSGRGFLSPVFGGGGVFGLFLGVGWFFDFLGLLWVGFGVVCFVGFWVVFIGVVVGFGLLCMGFGGCLGLVLLLCGVVLGGRCSGCC